MKVEYYQFVQNSMWELTSVDVTYDPTFVLATDVTYIMHLKRKPLHYILNIILPIMCLNVLNVFVFIVPADAGEKMGYTVSIFLALAVFLTMISAELPVNSDNVSIMSIYLMMQLGLSVVVIFITSLQLRLHHRTSERDIGVFWRSLVNIGRSLRCVDKENLSRCCLRRARVVEIASEGKSSPTTETDSQSKSEEILKWADVSSAIDFFSFWILVFAEVVVSIAMFSYCVMQ
jgi:hypothetical protein